MVCKNICAWYFSSTSEHSFAVSTSCCTSQKYSESNNIVEPHHEKTLLCQLTHLRQVEFPCVINWTSPFQFKGLMSDIFLFYSHFNRTFCKQIVETMIGCHVLWHLIWVCTVCLCPTKRMLGLYGLNKILGHKIVYIFLSVNLNICFGCSIELSHWDSSFEYQEHYDTHTLILRP